MVAHGWLGLQVALAWFCGLNVVLGGLVMAGQPFLIGRLARRNLPGLLLAARLLPAYGSLAIVLSGVGPAYALYEPIGAGEQPGWLTLALTSGGAVLLVLGAVRGWLSARSTSRMLARLTVGARALTGLPVPIPAFAVNGRSGVLLTGIVRPRLYVSRGILARLTAEELGMAVAHEVAHQRAWDNGKRWLIACAPDLLAFTRRGAELESRWRGSVERAADTAAAGRSRAAATTLASALVKVARFCAGHGAAVPSCSSFHEDDFLAGRIRVLLGESSPDCPTGARRIALRAVPSVMLLACLGGRAALQLVHAGTEWLVRLP